MKNLKVWHALDCLVSAIENNDPREAKQLAIRVSHLARSRKVDRLADDVLFCSRVNYGLLDYGSELVVAVSRLRDHYSGAS